MDLMIKRYNGILGLVEFKSAEKRNVYFENCFGIIKDDKLLIHNSDIVFNSNDIVSIQVFEKKAHNYTALRLCTSIILIALFLLQVLGIGLSILCCIIFVSLVFFKKAKKYYLQFVYLDDKQKTVFIEAKELVEVTIFIEKFRNYRNNKNSNNK